MAESKKDVIATFWFKGGPKYEVVECSYGFTQNYDTSNTPSGAPTINLINLVVKASEKIELADWMITTRAEKKGFIKIKLTESKSRTIEFEKGYCVNYNERFDNYSGSSYLISLGILAKDIKINEINYKPEWD